MSIVTKKFGETKDGKTVTKYTMTNKNGMEVSLLDLGADIANIFVADKNGVKKDVVLGFDTVAEYEVNRPGFGAVIGRYANRIANGEYTLNGKKYTLDQNDETNCLHGGKFRFEHCMYEAECIENLESDSVAFTRMSKDMEQGFPGNMTYTITYTLNDADELMLEYYAVSDEDTIINMTNHCYFNIGIDGYSTGSVVNQDLQVFADYYTPVDDILIPTGEIRSVEGTALDFRKMYRIGERMGKATPDETVVDGYDHNYVLNKGDEDISLAIRYEDKESGRYMEVFTDCPGMQVYNSVQLNDDGHNGLHHDAFSAICFESQNFPNAVNQEGFPNSILRAGDEFESATVFRFGIID